jgi:hypothetical protein
MHLSNLLGLFFWLLWSKCGCTKSSVFRRTGRNVRLTSSSHSPPSTSGPRASCHCICMATTTRSFSNASSTALRHTPSFRSRASQRWSVLACDVPPGVLQVPLCSENKQIERQRRWYGTSDVAAIAPGLCLAGDPGVVKGAGKTVG